MILLLKLVAEKSATTFGDLPDCLVWSKIRATSHGPIGSLKFVTND